MKHFILTRYNYGWEPNKLIEVKKVTKKRGISSDVWLWDRLKLFERYYLPSIEAQTNKNFKIYLSMSDKTPQEYLDKLSNLEHIELTFDQFDESFKNKLFDQNQGEDIITTRLDNDDAISPLFVQRVQDSVKNLNSPTLIDVWGYKFMVSSQSFSEESYSLPYASSFCSVFSPKNERKWCYECQHTHMPKQIKNHQLLRDRLYLQVIHDQNLANNSSKSRKKLVKGFSHLFNFSNT